MNYAAQRTRLLQGLTWGALLFFVASNLMNLLYPGTETSMGEVQRLFYMHVGSFAGAFLAFFVALFAGIAYLRTRDLKWDHLGVAGVEVGLGLSTITIVTGAVWARPVWGTFWTWDPRLTTIAIMSLVYAAYLFLRSAIEDSDQRRRFAAVFAILSFSSVLLTVFIIRVRPDVIHPVVVGPSVTQPDSLGDFNLSGRIQTTLFVSLVMYIGLAVVLLWHRIRLEQRIEQLQARRAQVLSNL